MATDTGVRLTRAYAAQSKTSGLAPWQYEPRLPRPDDVSIDILYCGVCHTDIHFVENDWGMTIYPVVPGHEIIGRVTAVGPEVSRFAPGDIVGVGCMVDSCRECSCCDEGLEQYCLNGQTLTYNGIDRHDGKITYGGYSERLLVSERFVVNLPEGLDPASAAPLLCAGITTYSPLMKFELKKGDKVGVAGIGGLGHMAIKLAVSKGAEVYAFTTSPSKVEDILAFGAKEAVVVDDIKKLSPYKGKLDYMICTIPVQYDVAAYASVVKPFGTYTQVGMPEKFELTVSAIGLSINRVNFNASLIGGMKETQDVIDYCADNKVLPKIQIIKAEQINEAWENVVNKKARYRYVIDAATF